MPTNSMGTTHKLDTTVGGGGKNTMASTSRSAVLGTTVKTQGVKTIRDFESTTGSSSGYTGISKKTVREGQTMALTTKAQQSSAKLVGAGGTGRSDLSGTGRDMTHTRQEKRMADTARGEDDRPKLKIIKTEAARAVPEKKLKGEASSPSEADDPEEETSSDLEFKATRRSGRIRVYRGNMHLIQKANKEAGKAIILGKKPKIGPKKRAAEQGRSRKRSVLSTLRRRLFGRWMHEEVILKDPKASAAAQTIGLTQVQLRKLKWVFDEIDVDGSGSIDVEELFEYVDEKRTPIIDALFAIMDMDGNGTIEFEEFIRVCTTYCMYTEEDVLRFCFDCFDRDGSGAIDESEFIALCHTVNNADPMFSGNFRRALEEFDADADGLVDFPEFCSIYRKYPSIMFPAFRLQDSMQRITLGEHDWNRLHKSIEDQRRILEYRNMHQGRDPPLPPSEMWARTCVPCFFPAKIRISPALLQEAAYLS